MITKETIEKINSLLQYGDKKQLAINTGLSQLTINSFFKGYERSVTEATQSRIANEAFKIIEARKRKADKIEKKTNALHA